ncbi:MAG: B12-binding domain-containing radical SAM protein [Defluviitaleaceae bacterium]|nr:B12-binding domain-containing radical SAM protein [Defluviitaleaceae bacterium]
MKKTIPLFLGLYDTNLLGIRYLSSTLKSHGYDPHLIFLKTFNSYSVDEPTEKEYALLYDAVQEINPTYIGISIMSSFYLSVAQRIARDLKDKFNVPVIIGGAYATLFPEKCLAIGDVVCRGEGEDVIVEFTNALENGAPYDNIENLGVMTPEGAKINDIRNLETNLNKIPPPYFGEAHMSYINNDQLIKGDPEAHSHSYELTTSRGCPNRCSYCSTGSIRNLYRGKGPFIRQRKVANVMEELLEVKRKNPGLQKLRFWDEIFPWNREWVLEFANEYKAKIGLPFEAWGHPRITSDPVCISAMVDAGLSKIVIGIQSGCPNVRKEIYFRNETQEQVLNCSKVLAECKVPLVIYDFILGHPFETPEDLKETLALCRKLTKPFRLQLHGLSFLPGTPIEDIAVEKGVRTWDEIHAEQARPLREQYHSMAWWRQGHGAQDNEKIFWYSLIYLTQFPSGERIIKWALKKDSLRQNPKTLLRLHKLYNYRVQFEMGWRKLMFIVKSKLR